VLVVIVQKSEYLTEEDNIQKNILVGLVLNLAITIVMIILITGHLFSFEAINEELNQVTMQEAVPKEVLHRVGLDPDNMRVMSAQELIRVKLKFPS
jgi:coproporphyrinogen III oxidase-like Fe-S oxidoreductase